MHGWEHAPDLCNKCTVLTRRFIRGKVLFDLFDVFDSSHGLVSIDNIDVQTLTTAIHLTGRTYKVRPFPLMFRELLWEVKAGLAQGGGRKSGKGKLWRLLFKLSMTKLC
jgi:hypothetical protein